MLMGPNGVKQRAQQLQQQVWHRAPLAGVLALALPQLVLLLVLSPQCCLARLPPLVPARTRATRLPWPRCRRASAAPARSPPR